jgi:fructokinase
MARIVCLGEALIDFVADVTGVSIEDCPGFRKAAGGAPANVAAGVARLGGASAFVGKVGDDPFGRFLQRTLAELGVDTSSMRFDPEARTGLAFVSLLPGGERDFTFYRHPSADMRLRPEELPEDLLAGARIFHFGSISLIAEPARSATLAAAAAARSSGCLVSFDPNLRPPLWPSLGAARAAILEAMPLADLVKVSAEEAEFLAGEPVSAAAAQILAMGPRLACVTHGAEGSECFSTSRRVSAPGFRVDAVDSTGAGDGFVAGLLVWLDENAASLDLAEEQLGAASRFANAVGALACTRKGAIPALPRREAVDRLLAAA